MIKRKISVLLTAAALSMMMVGGCGAPGTQNGSNESPTSLAPDVPGTRTIVPTAEPIELEDGLTAVAYEGGYGLDTFLEEGGAASDAEVMAFLSRILLTGDTGLSFRPVGFGCSTLSVQSPEDESLFGRNFDWEGCNALIVSTKPENGYASISTVNLDFLSRYGSALNQLSEQAAAIAAVYAPLDGMNEQGLCVAVLMIQDEANIEQNTGKPDITTTTAVRLLLDRAADVEEAVALLAQYDMHASMNMMIHFAISDAKGRSVAVEYIDNEMVVVETPAVTNFYLSEGSKQGVGTAQSHTRYNVLMDTLSQNPSMNMDQVRDAMDSVSKDNFGEFESTEWTVVYNQTTGEVRYYHRENYVEGYTFYIGSRDR